MLARDRLVRRAAERRRYGPPTPSSSVRRGNLERQYRGLINQGRNSKYPGTLQIYKRDRIKKMTGSQLRKTLQDAYRPPSWR